MVACYHESKTVDVGVDSLSQAVDAGFLLPNIESEIKL